MENEYLHTEEPNAYKALSFRNKKKKYWEDELIIASRELEFQSQERERQVAEFVIPTHGTEN
jgi:hypothetical protein